MSTKDEQSKNEGLEESTHKSSITSQNDNTKSATKLPPRIISMDDKQITISFTHLGRGSSNPEGKSDVRAGSNFVNKEQLKKFKAIYLAPINDKTGWFTLRVDKPLNDHSIRRFQIVSGHYNGFWSSDALDWNANAVFPAGKSDATEFNVYGTNDA
ncbi:hypothetical protein [Pseudomonas sp. RIT623]|uniref:hypothetical protein n=1 Tax=Pseudomonas sp. RIT623 TaxID=2559075 RepID=UPI00106F29E2|nr:hypothetical protein [Pseudomonas sp. RIT623]TFF38598.1 hypothetical protein E3U47_15940 [Pseudomonas sp. RIT623]